MNEKHYLLTVCGDVEPVLSGPLDTQDEVLAMAREHRALDDEQEDGLFILSIDAEGKLHAEAFAGDDFEE